MTDLKIRWALHRDESEPTTRQRGLFIIRELASQGYDVAAWDGSSHADIIVLQYNMRLLNEAMRTGATVVADINDMVFAEHHPYYRETIAGLQRVHCVTAGTERIRQHLRRLHPFVRVVEEPVDPRYFAVEPKKHEGVNLVWCGMNDNLVYFRECDDALEQLAREFEFTVNIVCPKMDGFGKPNADKVAAKPYPAEFHEWTRERLLEQMALADMAVVPLFSTEWCQGKSGNKSLSFMAAGIPTTASDVLPYRPIIDHGRNGFLCTHPEDWYDALHGQLTDAQLRRSIGVAGRLTANQFTVEKIADDWLAVFEEIRPR